MRSVFLVHLRTTGETWHTAVCEDMIAVESVLANYGITERTSQHASNAMQYETAYYAKPGDTSQTAAVVKRDVVLGASR